MLYSYQHELNIEISTLVQRLPNFMNDRISINRILSSTVRGISVSLICFNTTINKCINLHFMMQIIDHCYAADQEHR